MKKRQCKVHWHSERADEDDNNNGLHYGIYTFDVTEKDFDEDAGLGAYVVIDVRWYKTEKERDNNFITNKNNESNRPNEDDYEAGVSNEFL